MGLRRGGTGRREEKERYNRETRVDWRREKNSIESWGEGGEREHGGGGGRERPKLALKGDSKPSQGKRKKASLRKMGGMGLRRFSSSVKKRGKGGKNANPGGVGKELSRKFAKCSHVSKGKK